MYTPRRPGTPSPPQPDNNNINLVTSEPVGTVYGPDMFAADLAPFDPTTVLNEPLPRAWSQGGLIESVKRAVVTGMRDALQGSSFGDPVDGQKFNIDIEYPDSPESLPHIWVQFTIDSLKRGGLDMGVMTQDGNGVWGEVRTWMFEGKITLTCAAESSLDRDRLSDTIISNLAFSRHPDEVYRNPKVNTKQHIGLIEAINNNKYVSMTLNTDNILTGGQTVTNNIPWAGNKLLYEDNYTVTCEGQFNMRFGHDGMYTLTEIDLNPQIQARGPVLNDAQWRGAAPPRWQVPPQG
jgi:hypothetical protein